MLFLKKPDPGSIRRFLAGQAGLGLSYEGVGATADEPPRGYVLDHTRAEVGYGEQAFDSAKRALESWQQFRLDWLDVSPQETPIRQGEVLAILARSAGVWWLNACRIVYVIDDSRPAKRFGFAYGTLPDHVGSGEERFLVEMDGAGHVWFDILAFSRPRHFLARIGYPFVRVVQKRFGRESAAVMRQAVQALMCRETSGR